MGSTQYSKIPFIEPLAISSNFALTSSTETRLSKLTFTSIMDPVITGTLTAMANNLPAISGITLPTALAAPVLVGTMLYAAPEASYSALGLMSLQH